jgi:hypothetical protein
MMYCSRGPYGPVGAVGRITMGHYDSSKSFQTMISIAHLHGQLIIPILGLY